jgi:transcriptional regulator with XRE-family HTH domain
VSGRSVGDRIGEARTAAGLTQPDVASAIGVKQQQVSTWERGGRIPDKHRAALAATLGIELTELLTWIADEEQRRHDIAQRELATTVQTIERFVGQFEKMLEVLEHLREGQAEILRLLRGRDGNRRSG